MKERNATMSAITNDELENLLEIYEKEWDFEITDVSTIGKLQELRPTIEDTKKELFQVYHEYRKRNMLDTINVRMNGLLEKIYYSEHLMHQYEHLHTLQEMGKASTNANILYKFTEVNFDKIKPFQKLVIKMFDVFEKRNYKKIGSMLYSEIKTPFSTHAWEPVGSILEIIHNLCSMCNDYENWLLLTSSRDLDKQLSNFFEKTDDYRLSTLKRNRTMFSFKNGIYFAIYDYQTYTDKFIHYGSAEHTSLSHFEVSAKYFNIDFKYPDVDNPYDIPTPCLDRVFNYQRLPREVIEISKMLMGRMLYDVDQLDHWQVILMLIGSGGSGKSTIHNVVRMFYESEDVGIIGNNFQKTFGLSDIFDKYIFLAPEVKKDWGIDQAEFQEMVSGGKVNVNIKNQKSKVVQWTAPGMLAGNENPGFVDNASSIQRRVIVTRFDLKVQQSDPQLSKKLEFEIDAIMKQCNMFYLNYVRQRRYEDIWRWLPNYFYTTQTMMACASNSLNAFLNSDQVKLGTEHCIPMDEFFRKFNSFCSENNYKRPNINVDMYTAPFTRYNIQVHSKITRAYRGKIVSNTTFLSGVDLRNE